MNDIIPLTNIATDESENCFVVPATNLFYEQRQAMLFSFGENPEKIASINERESLSPELTAQCSGMRLDRNIKARNSFVKRTQLLIAAGLVKGITPMSIRNQLGAEIPDFVSSWQAGDGADLRKRNC